MSADQPLEIRRSARRKRTLTVFRERGRLVALVPQRLTRAQEAELLGPLVERFLKREAGAGARLGDAGLAERAELLHRRYLRAQLGLPLPAVRLRWVDNQFRRWGSCSFTTGEIRLSSRLRTMPDWVLDYVLLHELVHLYQPDHSPEFHRLLSVYPRLAEAKAYLRGYQHAADVGDTAAVAGLEDDLEA
jgi:predicted metal-dependent hydrolase